MTDQTPPTTRSHHWDPGPVGLDAAASAASTSAGVQPQPARAGWHPAPVTPQPVDADAASSSEPRRSVLFALVAVLAVGGVVAGVLVGGGDSVDDAGVGARSIRTRRCLP